MRKWLFSLFMGIGLCLSVQAAVYGSEGQPGQEQTVRQAREFEEPGIYVSVMAREFEELGICVSVMAQEDELPENAVIRIVEAAEASTEALTEIVQRRAEEELAEKSREAAEGGRTIFNMYSDLGVSVENSYAFRVELSYKDAQGNEYILRPGENNAIQVEITLLDGGDASRDEMRTAEVFSLTGNGAALLSTEEIYTGANYYTIADLRYFARADAAALLAQQRVWDIINTYAEPTFFLEDPYREQMTEAQYEELHQAALETVAGCGTEYEAIQAIVGLVADRIYYDYYYLDDKPNHPTFINPYEVYANRRSVCAGYARLVRSLCVSVGIPCMNLPADNHEYNAIYDSGSRKWIFADATWCSENKYTVERQWEYHGGNYFYFDLEPEQIAELSYHEVYEVKGLLDPGESSLYYSLAAREEDWEQMDWHMTVSGAKGAKAKAVGSLAGFPVTDLEPYVFYECEFLEEIDLSAAKVTQIGGYAFRRCTALTNIVFPAELTEIGDWAFGNCSALTGVDLSNAGLERIGYAAFYDCPSLEYVFYPDTLAEIGGWAFAKCIALQTADLSHTKVQCIDEHTYQGCLSLKSASCPASLTEIREWAFGECQALTEADLSNAGLECIGYAAFYDCEALQEVSMRGSGVARIGEFAFGNCYALTKITFPDVLERVDSWAFGSCTALKEIDLVKTKVAYIGESAFYNCSLASIIRLPGTLSEIGSRAFAYAPNISNTMVVTPLSAEQIRYPGVNGEWSGRNITVCTHLYTVDFDGNGAEDGEMGSRIYGGAVEYKLPLNNYRKDFCEFTGWNTKMDGSGTAYGEGDVFTDLSPEDGAVVTLYAQWQDNSYREGELIGYNGKFYFVENGVMAVSKEVFANGAWRWFDADGAMAVDKDVYQLSFAGPYGDNEDGTGKWVRYNERGEMIKGEDYRYGGWYRFDEDTGAMVKGWYVGDDGSTYYYDWESGRKVSGEYEIDGIPCYFDLDTGAGADCVWITLDGKEYWYEHGVRQGLEGRGKEIYDPGSDAWYWLDSVDQGKKAVNKDVYQESYSAYPDREDGTGKWVRYDENGHMVKGWQETTEGIYYFEEVTGAMAKGYAAIDGVDYYFDAATGKCAKKF